MQVEKTVIIAFVTHNILKTYQRETKLFEWSGDNKKIRKKDVILQGLRCYGFSFSHFPLLPGFLISGYTGQYGPIVKDF